MITVHTSITLEIGAQGTCDLLNKADNMLNVTPLF